MISEANRLSLERLNHLIWVQGPQMNADGLSAADSSAVCASCFLREKFRKTFGRGTYFAHICVICILFSILH